MAVRQAVRLGFPRRRLPSGPVKSADLPPATIEAIVVALKAGQDPAAKLPRAWRGHRTGLNNQAEPETVANVSIGADLALTIEPYGDGDRLRIQELGYLPSIDDLTVALRRGWVRCWFADRQPTARHPAGAATVSVAVYDFS